MFFRTWYFLIFLFLSISGCAGLPSPFGDSSPITPAIVVTPVPIPSPPPTQPQQVALLLPLQGNLSNAGQAIKEGFLAAYQADTNSMRPAKINVIDSNQSSDVQGTYQQAVSQGNDIVVGPLTKPHVQAISNMGRLPVAVLALNNLDPNQPTPPNFYQFGLSPLDEARQAAGLAWQNGHRAALIIVPQSPWGQTVNSAFRDQWQAVGGTVTDTLFYSNNTQALDGQIRKLLHFNQPADTRAMPTRRKDFDVIFLAADPQTAREIRPLLKFYYAGDISIYATSLVYSGTPQPASDNDLNGIVFCDAPWVFGGKGPTAALRQQLSLLWSNNFQQNARLYALGVDAYQVSMQLRNLATSPQQTIDGATGILSLNDQHRIVRQLVCAQFQNGIPVPIG